MLSKFSFVNLFLISITLFLIQGCDQSPEYVGEYKGEKRHGKGTLTWSDGYKFEGEFKDGIYVKGKMTYPKGNVYLSYEGTYIDTGGEYPEKNGEGILRMANGEVYQGSFELNEFHGFGVYSWPSGQKYEGEWANGKFNGKGIFTYKGGGLIDKGIFKDGKFIKALGVVKGNYLFKTVPDSTYFISEDKKWYAEKILTKECIFFDLPAYIKNLQIIKKAGGADYNIFGEISVDETIVQTSVKNYQNWKEVTAYRGKDLCEKVQAAKNKSGGKELDKYK